MEKRFYIVASRGRNPDNPSDRQKGIPTEQRFEINRQGLCNTITSVLKDNLVLEIWKQYELGKQQNKDGLSAM